MFYITPAFICEHSIALLAANIPVAAEQAQITPIVLSAPPKLLLLSKLYPRLVACGGKYECQEQLAGAAGGLGVEDGVGAQKRSWRAGGQDQCHLRRRC